MSIAIRIMKCLKEHEPEIWHELKKTLKQKLPIHDVSNRRELLRVLYAKHEEETGYISMTQELAEGYLKIKYGERATDGELVDLIYELINK